MEEEAVSQGILAAYRSWKSRLAKDILARKKTDFFILLILCSWKFTENKWNSKWIDQGLIALLTKEGGAWLQRMMNCAGATRKYMGELTGEKSYSVRSVDANSSQCWFPCLWWQELFFVFWHGAGLERRGEHLRKRKSMPCIRQRMDGRRTVHASVDSKLSSSQNNLYAKMAYWGLAYSDFLQWLSQAVLGSEVWRSAKIEERTHLFIYSMHFY